jgi:hypothetical protein
MGKIVLDTSGELRKGVFYRFNVQFDDDLAPDIPTDEWVLAPRTPTNGALIDAGQPGYLRIEDLPKSEDCVETNDCPADPAHVTHRYYKIARADASGYSRLSPFIETNGLFFAVSAELRERLEALNVKGSRIDPIKILVNQSDVKEPKAWAFQFVGKARRRLPKFVDVPNRCPHCGISEIVCESCGYWMPYCNNCKQYMVVARPEHKGVADRRIPFEDGLFRVIEGKTWDGSDLIGGVGPRFASKRFTDWLLRIHAAPFYAEPVYFCLDGMSDQQKKWFDDLQKPFEV